MKEWLLARWKWVAAGLAVLLAFLFGFFSRRPKILTPSSDSEAARRKVEEESTARQAKVRAELEERLREIYEDRDAAIQDFTEEQLDRYETLKGDPTELNRWLLSVGKKQRQ